MSAASEDGQEVDAAQSWPVAMHCTFRSVMQHKAPVLTQETTG